MEKYRPTKKLDVPVLFSALNTISLASAIIVICIVLTLVIYKKITLARSTLRIKIGIAVVDAIRHLLLYFTWERDEEICELIGFLNKFFDLVYTFLNVCIALNLHLIFLHNIYPRKVWEKVYWVGTISISVLLTGPFLVGRAYGTTRLGSCFLKHASYIEVCGILLFNFLTITTAIYCLLIPILIQAKLALRGNEFINYHLYLKKDPEFINPGFKRKFCLTILASSMYPIAYSVSLSGNVIHIYFMYVLDILSPLAKSICFIGRGSTGILNLVAIFCDPKFLIAFYNHTRDVLGLKSNTTIESFELTYKDFISPFDLEISHEIESAQPPVSQAPILNIESETMPSMGNDLLDREIMPSFVFLPVSSSSGSSMIFEICMLPPDSSIPINDMPIEDTEQKDCNHDSKCVISITPEEPNSSTFHQKQAEVLKNRLNNFMELV